jgi:simple sugar transport system permease protein
MNGSGHTPLFHISKRSALPWYLSWAIRIAAVVLALIVCALVTTLLTGVSPLGVYATIIQGSFGTVRKFWVLLQELAILLCVSLAVTPAFKMRFWNIGAEGQVIVGGLACAAVMITLSETIQSNTVMLLLMLVVSVAAGALWGFLPAFFKAHWNTNETLFTLMMNYIAIQLAAYFIIIWEVPKGSGKIGIINQKTRMGWLPYLGGKQYAIIILLVAILTILIFIYLKYSKQGYEIAVVGESERTARYAGIKVERVIIRTMILSGALCGFMGMLLVGGTDHSLSTELVGGRGFTAVMVSWLAKFNPIVMILTSFLLVFMQLGAKEVATNFYLNESFSEILTGIILFFIIGCEFFITYKIQFAKSGKEA